MAKYDVDIMIDDDANIDIDDIYFSPLYFEQAVNLKIYKFESDEALINSS